MKFTHAANPVRVNARKISELTSFEDGSGFLAEFDEGDNVHITNLMTARYEPVVGDYVVVQDDGYIYVNPKDVFERKYSPIAQGEQA
jgi:3-dehydroquinate synthase class II